MSKIQGQVPGPFSFKAMFGFEQLEGKFCISGNWVCPVD